MDWLSDLLLQDSIARTILIYSFVISIGVMLGRLKIFGVSLGVTFVLFTGIVVAHFGFDADPETLHFLKEFGLILFVFSIGLQVGPSFFTSFKQGGMKLNMLAISVIALNVIVAISLYFILKGRVSMPMMVGIMSGAVTNTPGLGAAQQTLDQLHNAGQIATVPSIALGYVFLSILMFLLVLFLLLFLFVM